MLIFKDYHVYGGFLIRFYFAPNGIRRYSMAQCYDKTRATMMQIKWVSIINCYWKLVATKHIKVIV